MRIKERFILLIAIVAVSVSLLAGLFVIVDTIEPVPIRPGAAGSSVVVDVDRGHVGDQPGI